MSIKPASLNVSQSMLDDLRLRLSATRWPDEIDGADWDYGTNLGYMKSLADYWQHEYDWRKQEARINQLPQFTADIDGQTIRFIYEHGKGPNPIPIILLHGWPDSMIRYFKLIPMLTDPVRFGGDPNTSFDVVVPQLVGPTRGPIRQQAFLQVAERLWKLMTEELGYARFAAAGGDGGSVLAQALGMLHPDSMIGLHLTDIGYHALMGQLDNQTEAEKQYIEANQAEGYEEGAYALLMGTKPQTLAFGLNDSPVGWAAWIIEKFRAWSDCDGDIERVYSKDDLLDNIMLHWIEGVDPRGYREEWVSPSLTPGQPIDVPVALALPPKDQIKVPPRELAERTLKNIQRWTVLPRGGHFAAMEDPASMAKDMRAFFSTLKPSY